MANSRAFIHIQRELPRRRPVPERVRDWDEVYTPFPEDKLKQQAARCMDCGVPFCHQGCPLGNLIPDWNDLVTRDRWREVIDRLHLTNNFPEFTGKLCPAPCEDACVLAINSQPVTIKQVEWAIIEHAWREGWVVPRPPAMRTGKSVAVVGSGPAGLAAAQELNRAGHLVTVYERDDRIGGLIRYGIPDFKMDKGLLNRRLAQLEAEGITFRPNSHIGRNIPVDELRREHDAIVLALGALKPRDLRVPGRDLDGIHFAMDYLTLQNKRNAGDFIPDSEFISAEGKHVVIIGGGDTGADCLGTAHRQGAASVTQLQYRPAPPEARGPSNPWPEWGYILRTSPAHEEGGEREFSISTQEFVGRDGRVVALRAVRTEVETGEDGRPKLVEIPGTETDIRADLVLIAIGFAGPETNTVVRELGLELTSRGAITVDPRTKMTSVPGVFAAGDAERGASLIVNVIADGRNAARSVDRYLMGSTQLPGSP
jgi:glutamate synthase (NADPH/NADH) small chain